MRERFLLVQYNLPFMSDGAENNEENSADYIWNVRKDMSIILNVGHGSLAQKVVVTKIQISLVSTLLIGQ